MSQAPEQADRELDAALSEVENLGEAPLPVHAEAFERVHELLQRRLGEADG